MYGQQKKLPDNIPDLMLEYLNQLNRKGTEFDDRVMDSIADLAWIDIQVVLPEVPEVTVGMLEGGEEVEVHELFAALASKPPVGRGALRERRGRC